MPSSTGCVQSMVNLRVNFFFLATLGFFIVALLALLDDVLRALSVVAAFF
jgi:hypothetical protein